MYSMKLEYSSLYNFRGFIMGIVDLAKRAPELCGAEHSEQHARIAELVFKDEIENIDSPFSRVKDIRSRILPIAGWIPSNGNEEKKKYILDLAEYACMRHYIVEHKDHKYEKEAQDLAVSLAQREPLYKDVSSVYSVAHASGGIWA